MGVGLPAVGPVTYSSSSKLYMPGARFSKRVYLPMNARRMKPMGPLRCLPMMISAMPLCSVSG
ncbi:hypothetical protein D3C76_1712700 [compost metagenome]